MHIRLDRDFYTRPATTLAPELLGKVLCRKFPDGELQKFVITETECYYGPDDSASHASHGKTERTKTMFCEGGITYVYLCYGIHFMLNIVTGCAGHPEAVLIRGIDKAKGPGRVAKLLQIDKNINAADLCNSDVIWLQDIGARPKFRVSKRIGIGYAKQIDQDRLWRFETV